MKKTIFLLVGLIALLATGCNEKNLIKNIEGDWHVQKYQLDGKDKTHWFDTTYPLFKWSFTADKKFYKSWETHKIGGVYTSDTIRHYDSIAQMTVIDSVVTTSTQVPFVFDYYLRGTWLLTNANKYLQTRDTTENKQYEIVDHSSSSLHLATGNEDYFLSQ